MNSNVVQMERGRQNTCPKHVAEQVLAYIDHGVTPGAFVQAVIENDLKAAITQADCQERLALPQIVKLLETEAPDKSFGSRARFISWLSFHAGLRLVASGD